MSDYLGIEEFKKRAKEHIAKGYKTVGSTKTLVVKFESDFDSFASNVAHAIRHYVVYRSDGGRFARGLVRQTGQLQEFHRDMARQGIASGTKVSLLARFYRRIHSDPTQRWMLSIQFGKPVVVESEGEHIVASRKVTAESEKNLGASVLQHAAKAIENPLWSGDRQSRLRDWLKLADQIGYPRYLYLWYYNRVATFEYVNWDTAEARRKAMTAGTSGILPFKGTTGGMSGGKSFAAPPNTPWRVYPFREAFNKSRMLDDEHRTAVVGNELRFAESEIFESIREMDRQIKRTSFAAGQDPFQGSVGAASDSISPLASKFYKDVGKRLKNPVSLYATYMKYGQTKPGWADKW